MSTSGPPAQVTGISPVEGVPGTKLTLRGEHFGQSALDLTHVFVGGIDVSPSVRWFSSRKLSVITPLGTGELEIVVVTKSGGIGTSELTYIQNMGQKIGPQEQVSYWPEDERRRCPAIIERGGGVRQEGVADVVDASLSITGLPAAELSRLGVPLSDSALMKIYPCTGSVLLSEPDFDPMLFLLKYYKNASFEDLVMTRNYFSRNISASGCHESSNVIKNNLYLIFRCLEGLEDLRSEMKRSNVPGNYEYNASGQKTRSKVKEGTVETRLEKKLTDSWNQGHDLFKDVLRCREAANSARNVLSIMERFSFLFRLPESIRKTIKQGEYGLAINDYKRAKALFTTSSCGAFRRVFEEIETVVAQFRDTLKAELLQVPIDVDEAMKRIKYLEQLDVDYDPYVLCIETFKNWLLEQIRSFQKRYQEWIDASSPAQPETQDHATSQGRLDKHQMTLQFVKQICNLLSTQCVQFWRLQTVCLAASSKSKHVSSEKVDGQQPLPDGCQMINIELIHLLTSCIREVVLQLAPIGTRDTVLSGSASTCVQEFRNCCLGLPLDVVPSDAQAVLRRLSYDLRRHAIRDVLRSSQTATESLHFRENWEVEVADNGGSITHLPLAYESVVAESLSRCRTLMSPRTSLENSLFDAPDYQDRFAQLFSNVMLGFLNTLQYLAEQIDLSLSRQTEAADAPFSAEEDDTGPVEPTANQASILAQARGVLLLVSNADWAARHANSHIFAAYSAAGFSNVDDLKSRVTSAWEAATEKLVQLYVRIRTAWLCEPLSAKSYVNDTSQNLVKTVLSNLSHIHAELVLLLGIPFVAKVGADIGGGGHGDGPLSCDRTPSIMKAVVVQLSNNIRVRSGDAVDNATDRDAPEESVKLVLHLLELIISGDSLENALVSLESGVSLKESLRLVAKALDAGTASEGPPVVPS